MRKEEMISWSTFHVPATVLDAEDSGVNLIDKISALMEFIVWEKVENKQ